MPKKGDRQIMCKNGHYYSEVGRTSDGRCCAKCSEDYYEKNREEILRKKKEKLENDPELREKKNEYLRKYNKEHKEEHAVQGKIWRDTHKQECLEQKRRYRKEHPEVHRKSNQKSAKRKLKTDITFKFKVYLRNRIHDAIKNNRKGGSAVRDLGCSIEFLKGYIKDKFYGDMTWDNWGSYWQLDHIEELHTFDLIDPIQFKQAVHYTNLQPLTIPDHKKKTAYNKKSQK